jgi:peptidoglycan/xylan/chitin deacetylase (PgdA/CDA1 family)
MLYYHDVPSEAGLEAQLFALVRAGYQPTTVAAVLDALDGKTPPPPGCIVLTFDDALRSQHRNALPVLSRWAMNGTFYMMPSFRDGVHVYMSPEEIQEVAKAGMEIGSHTLNHPSLPALRRTNPGAFFAEIHVSRTQIESLIGRPVETFAYPNGAVDAPTAAEIESAGYRGAVSTIQGNWQTSSLRYWLRRYPANPWEAPSEILTRIRTVPR